jgi:hypothetical protein
VQCPRLGARRDRGNHGGQLLYGVGQRGGNGHSLACTRLGERRGQCGQRGFHGASVCVLPREVRGLGRRGLGRSTAPRGAGRQHSAARCT